MFASLKDFKDKSLLEKTTLRALRVIWREVAKDETSVEHYSKVLEEMIFFFEDNILNLMSDRTVSKCYALMAVILR